MKATVLSYRRGVHTMHGNQLLLEIEGVDSKELASRYIGKRVIWISPAKKQIFGKITNTHGNNGVVRARFSKGLPGTAVNAKVEIIER
ncbi:MAG: 50S ribosomal protein L35ae [Candidatus Aenigmarchaeota archaeon]|nr:50S ribosomal protein L35ae [Candidatus Aenigmarchaeota archaeon]